MAQYDTVKFIILRARVSLVGLQFRKFYDLKLVNKTFRRVWLEISSKFPKSLNCVLLHPFPKRRESHRFKSIEIKVWPKMQIGQAIEVVKQFSPQPGGYLWGAR